MTINIIVAMNYSRGTILLLYYNVPSSLSASPLTSPYTSKPDNDK